MINLFYRWADAGLAFLWKRFGVRRWWVYWGGFALCTLDIPLSHGVGHCFGVAFMGAACAASTRLEFIWPAETVNEDTLRRRDWMVVKVILAVALILTALRLLASFFVEIPWPYQVGDVGFFLWSLSTLGMIPTGPREPFDVDKWLTPWAVAFGAAGDAVDDFDDWFGGDDFVEWPQGWRTGE